MRLPRDGTDHPLARSFRRFVQDPAFPYVGTKSALESGRLLVPQRRSNRPDI